MIFFRNSNLVKNDWIMNNSSEIGYLLLLSVLFLDPLSELSFFDAGIQYGCFEEKDAKKISFVHNKPLF